MIEYPAKNIASVIFATSPGWNVMGPSRIHTRAPRISPAEMPGTSGRISNSALTASEM